MPLPPKREYSKGHKKSNMKTSDLPPVTFIGGLYKTHSVMCSKPLGVDAKR